MTVTVEGPEAAVATLEPGSIYVYVLMAPDDLPRATGYSKPALAIVPQGVQGTGGAREHQRRSERAPTLRRNRVAAQVADIEGYALELARGAKAAAAQLASASAGAKDAALAAAAAAIRAATRELEAENAKRH